MVLHDHDRDTGGFLKKLFPFTRDFQERVNVALNDLEKKLSADKISASCQEFFGKLGITAAAFLDKMHALEDANGFVNAPEADTALVSFREGQNWQTWARSWLRVQQQEGLVDLGPNNSLLDTITIREVFQQYGGLRALSAPGVVFLRGGSAANAATIGHEILHQFDALFDPEIKRRLGLPPSADTSDISKAFKEACL